MNFMFIFVCVHDVTYFSLVRCRVYSACVLTSRFTFSRLVVFQQSSALCYVCFTCLSTVCVVLLSPVSVCVCASVGAPFASPGFHSRRLSRGVTHSLTASHKPSRHLEQATTTTTTTTNTNNTKQ